MPDTPKRIQRKRTKGWKMPEGAIYVGRPTSFGNPYKVESWGRNYSVELYEKWLSDTFEGRVVAEVARRDLRGHDLACWCRLDEPCHADVLLRIANE